jgi:hypothetical protein
LESPPTDKLHFAADVDDGDDDNAAAELETGRTMPALMLRMVHRLSFLPRLKIGVYLTQWAAAGLLEMEVAVVDIQNRVVFGCPLHDDMKNHWYPYVCHYWNIYHYCNYCRIRVADVVVVMVGYRGPFLLVLLLMVVVFQGADNLMMRRMMMAAAKSAVPLFGCTLDFCRSLALLDRVKVAQRKAEIWDLNLDAFFCD